MHTQSLSLLSLALPCVFSSGTVTLFSSDLTGKPSVQNVKGEYNKIVTLMGSKARLSILYDMAAKKDFFKEVKLAGSLSELKYTITQAIGGKTGVTLSSVQQGIDLKAVGDSENMLTTVSATGSAGVGGVDIRYEPSYAIAKKLTKLKLSSAIGLGSGFTASGSVSATSAKDVDYDVELGYKSSLSEGRSLSATVVPLDQKVTVEVKDTTTEPGATWVATAGLAMGSKPSLKLKRAIMF